MKIRVSGVPYEVEMLDLHKTAEQYIRHGAVINVDIETTGILVDLLRQALAQPEQEPVAYVTIENISSWAQVPSIKWFKKPTEGPLYTAPVDAVNISQERVDETAKREQEPFIYVREDNERPFGGYEHCSEADAGAFPVYTAPPKREWVGLTDAEVEAWRGNYDFFDSALVREVEAKLKEKNT